MNLAEFVKIAILAFLFPLLLLSGCSPAGVVFREIAYSPSPSDPYRIWQAYVTDSGLLYLCGSVDNGREGMKRVSRVYNLELRLDQTLAPLRSDAIQSVQIDDHPSLQMTKGYLSDLCQFDKKRATNRPDETGWTKTFMTPGKDGYVKVHHADVRAGCLPTPPAKPRVVLYEVLDSKPPEYLLLGRLHKDGLTRQAILILGPEHIEKMW